MCFIDKCFFVLCGNYIIFKIFYIDKNVVMECYFGKVSELGNVDGVVLFVWFYFFYGIVSMGFILFICDSGNRFI